MKKNKKTFGRIISAVIAVAISSMLAFTALGADLGYSTSWGNYTKDICEIELGWFGQDTKIISLNKCFTDIGYSCFRFYKSSEVNSMNVWIQNNSGQQVSKKYLVDHDNYGNQTQADIYIYYYADITFQKGRPVVFWGEQGNMFAKRLDYKAWSY